MHEQLISQTSHLPALLNQTVISMSLFHFHQHTNEPSVWIFGYGSLQWNPGFEYTESRKAELPGFARRFWHGNTMHRGTDDLPGRVVTIVEHSEAVVTGLLFRVEGIREINAALKHLHYREIENGYDYETINVHAHQHTGHKENIHALTCIAREENEFFVGHAEDEHIAAQIATAKGAAGPNHEYLLKLATITRELFPHFYDDHLYKLEVLVRERLAITNQKVEL